MLVISKKQFAAMESVGRQRFVARLATHLRRDAPTEHAADCDDIADRALAFGDTHGLALEDEVAVIADVMLAVRVGALAPDGLQWLREIVEDGRPAKARRLRECFAIERRLAESQ